MLDLGKKFGKTMNSKKPNQVELNEITFSKF